MQDVIKREVAIKASREKVYNAIADPKLVVLWFPDSVTGDYAPGKHAVFGFGDCDNSAIYVEAARPHEYFAYRWVPGGKVSSGDVLGVPHTLVEFHIEETGAGECKVTLIESGFASLPAEVIEESLRQNNKGWDFMLDRLEKHFAAA